MKEFLRSFIDSKILTINTCIIKSLKNEDLLFSDNYFALKLHKNSKYNQNCPRSTKLIIERESRDINKDNFQKKEQKVQITIKIITRPKVQLADIEDLINLYCCQVMHSTFMHI